MVGSMFRHKFSMTSSQVNGNCSKTVNEFGKRVVKVVFTGGPCAGNSLILCVLAMFNFTFI